MHVPLAVPTPAPTPAPWPPVFLFSSTDPTPPPTPLHLPLPRPPKRNTQANALAKPSANYPLVSAWAFHRNTLQHPHAANAQISSRCSYCYCLAASSQVNSPQNAYGLPAGNKLCADLQKLPCTRQKIHVEILGIWATSGICNSCQLIPNSGLPEIGPTSRTDNPVTVSKSLFKNLGILTCITTWYLIRLFQAPTKSYDNIIKRAHRIAQAQLRLVWVSMTREAKTRTTAGQRDWRRAGFACDEEALERVLLRARGSSMSRPEASWTEEPNKEEVLWNLLSHYVEKKQILWNAQDELWHNHGPSMNRQGIMRFQWRGCPDYRHNQFQTIRGSRSWYMTSLPAPINYMSRPWLLCNTEFITFPLIGSLACHLVLHPLNIVECLFIHISFPKEFICAQYASSCLPIWSGGAKAFQGV